jgi:hypothetical protein
MLCVALGSDGLRGELTLLRAARALAAFEDAPAVTRDHLRAVAPSALRHRLRRDPLDEAGSTTRVIPHGGGGAGVSDAPAAPAEERWQRANLALACFALDPAALGGIWLRARVGPVRDRFLEGFDLAVRGKPSLGCIPISAMMRCSAASTLPRRWGPAPSRAPGLLHRPGVLVLPMAERAKPRLAARLARALDDEGPVAGRARRRRGPEERIPEALADRLAIHLDLSDIPLSDAPDLAIDTDAIVEARRILPRVTVPDSTVSDLAQVAFRLGITSLRAPLQALALARTSAALSGETEVGEPDLLTAVELVLAPRATQIPEARPRKPPEPDPPQDDSPEDSDDAPDRMTTRPHIPAEMMLEAARAMLPPDLLARMEAGRAARNAAAASGTGPRRRATEGPSPALPRRASRQRYARRPRGDAARRRPLAAAPPADHGAGRTACMCACPMSASASSRNGRTGRSSSSWTPPAPPLWPAWPRRRARSSFAGRGLCPPRSRGAGGLSR